MKSFIRIKKINGQEYLYEITPYYDKEKKQIRQKSKYLGKNVNGVPVKVRAKDQIPEKVLSHGEFVPLKKIAEDLELEKSLRCFAWQRSLADFDSGDELCYTPPGLNPYPELV